MEEFIEQLDKLGPDEYITVIIQPMRRVCVIYLKRFNNKLVLHGKKILFAQQWRNHRRENCNHMTMLEIGFKNGLVHGMYLYRQYEPPKQEIYLSFSMQRYLMLEECRYMLNADIKEVILDDNLRLCYCSKVMNYYRYSKLEKTQENGLSFSFVDRAMNDQIYFNYTHTDGQNKGYVHQSSDYHWPKRHNYRKSQPHIS